MKKIKILIIEDNEDDAILEMNTLQEAGYDVIFDRLDKLSSVEQAMIQSTYDCIISDYALGSFNGLDVLALYNKVGLDIPFFIISGTIGEEIAVAAMKAGMHDYIMKDRLSRFVPALERELHEAKLRKERKQIEIELQAKEKRFQSLIEQSADAFILHDFTGKIIEVNQQTCTFSGYTKDELLIRTIFDLTPDFDLTTAQAEWNKILPGQGHTVYGNLIRKDKGIIPAEVRIGKYEIKEQEYIVALFRDNTFRKIAEEKLQASITSLNDAQEMAQMGNWELDLATYKIKVSKNFYSIFGLAPFEIEITYDYLLSRLYPDDVLSITGYLEKAIETKKSVDIKFRIIMFDGSIKWCQNDVSPIFEKDNLIFLRGVLFDITEKKLKEDELKRLSMAVEQSPVSILITDTHSNIIYANKSSELSLGYSKEELIGINPRVLKSNTMDASIYQDLKCTIQSGKEWNGELVNKKKDGTLFVEDITITPIRNDGREIVNYLSIARDITEEKKADERIVNLNRLYATLSYVNQTIVRIKEKIPLLQEICNAIVTYGKFNLAWVGLIEAKERKIKSIIFRGVKDDCLSSLNISNQNGTLPSYILKSIEDERSFICQDIEQENYLELEKERHLHCGYHSVTAIPFRTKNTITGVLVVYSSEKNSFSQEDQSLLDEIGANISFALNSIEREEAFKHELELKIIRDEQLRQAQKMEALGQLAGGIAHDFNNVMGIIIGNLDLLEMYIQSNDTQKSKEKLDKVLKVALRGSEITQRLLTFSKKKTVDENTPIIDPRQILIGLQEIIEKLISGKELEYNLAVESYSISCNLSDFENAILNLCINSRDALPADGKIILCLENVIITEQEKFNYNLPVLMGEFVKISVEDNGSGISQENLEKVLNPFFTTKSNGTGLGLSNVYSFIEQSRGGIRIDSELGKGTKITMVIPKYNQSGDTKSNLHSHIQNNGRTKTQKKILIVDDEIDLLEVADAFLTASGYKTLKAINASGALAILAKERDIDLLFSDILMPGNMDGLQLAERVSTDYPQLKILLTSGFSKELQNNKKIKFPVLKKPYRKEKLLEELERITNNENA